MRKNGVNRELRKIAGGICAPAGFKANAISCGIRKDGGYDLALIATDRRYPVACVYSASEVQSVPALVTKKHMKKGYTAGILVNGGIANVYTENGEKQTENLCRTLNRAANIASDEFVVASTGEVGKPLDFSAMEKQLKPLAAGLEASEERGLLFAEAISSDGAKATQFSYGFDLGDIPCKLGGIYKGSLHVSPNMATTLVFLTTDVNITGEMLQKALSAEVRETLNLLDLDGSPSPNDTACIITSCKAGNYPIACEDTEYKKFCFVLRSALTEVCQRIASGNKHKKLFTCKAAGARSKQVARTLARTVVGLNALKASVAKERIDMESIVYTVMNLSPNADMSKVQISLQTPKGELVLFEDGQSLAPSSETLGLLLEADRLEIVIELRMGNYSARAFGAI